MSTATLDTYDTAAVDEPIEYRAIPTSAIVGLVLALLSSFILLTAGTSIEACLMVVPIPVLGIAFSLRAWARAAREPELYTGGKLALAGLTLSIFFLATGLGYGTFVYATEVPEGYERISFGGVRPSEVQQLGGVLVPPEIAALEGKKVFIKGYIRPDSTPVRTGIRQFLLVRDNNQCCFGDLSKVKYYDQIAVDMTGRRRLTFSNGVFRVGGVLKINERNAMLGPNYPVFSLEADYAQ